MEKLHIEKLNYQYSSPNNVWVLKSRRDGLGHVGCKEGGFGCIRIWYGNLRERDNLGKPRAHWRIILRWIFRKREEVYGLD